MPRIIIAFVLFAGAIASAQENDSTGIREAGLSEYRAGHYAQAEGLLRQSLAMAMKLNDQYGVALGYAALGDLYQAMMRFREAELSYRKGISTLTRQPEHAHALAIIWRNLAAVLSTTDYRDAFAAIKESSKLVKAYRLQDPVLNAEILNTLGILYFEQGRIDKAKSCFLHALEVRFLQLDGQESPRWEILNNLGRIYHGTGQYSKAEDAYKRALRFAETRFGSSHVMLTVTLNNLAWLYAETGRYQQAEEYMQRSFAIVERRKSPFEERQFMEALYTLAKTYLRQNRQAEAARLLSRAAEIARRNPGQMTPAAQIVQVLETYSRVLKDLLNPVEAERVDAEVRRIRASALFTVRATVSEK